MIALYTFCVSALVKLYPGEEEIIAIIHLDKHINENKTFIYENKTDDLLCYTLS